MGLLFKPDTKGDTRTQNATHLIEIDRSSNARGSAKVSSGFQYGSCTDKSQRALSMIRSNATWIAWELLLHSKIHVSCMSTFQCSFRFTPTLQDIVLIHSCILILTCQKVFKMYNHHHHIAYNSHIRITWQSHSHHTQHSQSYYTTTTFILHINHICQIHQLCHIRVIVYVQSDSHFTCISTVSLQESGAVILRMMHARLFICLFLWIMSKHGEILGFVKESRFLLVCTPTFVCIRVSDHCISAWTNIPVKAFCHQISSQTHQLQHTIASLNANSRKSNQFRDQNTFMTNANVARRHQLTLENTRWCPWTISMQSIIERSTEIEIDIQSSDPDSYPSDRQKGERSCTHPLCLDAYCKLLLLLQDRTDMN